MITVKFVRNMARYNRWQNKSLFDAADGLDDDARRADRGAFFKSIHGTLSHLLWADTMWMSRLDGWARPDKGIPESPDWVEAWPDLKSRRAMADARIMKWAEEGSDEQLAGVLTWYSGALKREVSKPKSLCVVHVFNHQTHHRGQVHAMLTACGARPEDTDLFVMPEGA